MTKDQFIIAIGASAGGLEALTAFFEHTPLDTVSYVIVPHLSPDFQSKMVEILSLHSNLEVIEATDGIQVEINKVYLIPNTKYMGIRDNRLIMSDKEGHSYPHMTIDTFFCSLAQERGNRAIGVVLSGVGRDGSRGAQAIQNAGGTVMVQLPSDAKFDGMPNATISASEPAYVLRAQELPAAIQNFVHQSEDDENVEELKIREEILPRIIDLIREKYPYDFSEYKLPTLIRRISRRMAQLNLPDENSFLVYLENNHSEIELLIGDFLIGVTSFFRDPEAFKLLEERVIQNLIENRFNKEYLKIWVAGCATGEEAYSIAILIREYLNRIDTEIEVKIFATDINRSALDQAGKGIYSSAMLKGLSQERLDIFFDKIDERYKIKPEIRKMLIFARHDLIKNPPFCYVDLISCRNMLIYIKPQFQKQILSKLGFGLQKNGYMFLGSSENLSIVKDDFTEISAKWKIYQNNHTRKHINLDSSLIAPLNDIPFRNPETAQEPKIQGLQPILSIGMTEVILEESGFCGVTIDATGNVVQAFGDLTPYLRSELFNFNLKELLPENLSVAFGASLQQVISDNTRVRFNGIEFEDPRTSARQWVDLVISPYHDRKSKNKGVLVLFRPPIEPGKEIGEDFNINLKTSEYIKQLEEDVSHLRQEQLTSQEILEVSKEAMQAYNEELLSANEEMQSANEELQSINEELETVNNEHKNTINELTDLNDDLNNYFNSNVNGQLFVDRDILLKKYSPGATQHINIREGDIGRPLSNITTNIRFETLVDDIKSVIDTGRVVLQEVESNEGRIYQVMTSPYLKKIDKLIHGAIITFYDISELKETKNALDMSNRMLTLATIAAEIETWSINIRSKKLQVSPRISKIFASNPEIPLTLEHIFAQVATEHRTSILDSINASINRGEKFETEFSVINSQNGEIRWIRAIGNLTFNNYGKAEYLAGVMQEVTDKKFEEIRKNRFMSVVSHELNTPATALKGYLHLLSEKAKTTGDGFSEGALAKADSQLKKMSNLINGFLNISRLESDEAFLDKSTFNICLLIKESVDELTFLHPGRNIVILECSDQLITADREKISQVVYNLVGNAIKYSPRDSEVLLTCLVVENEVEISIKDFGEGISIADQGKLFDKYYRIRQGNTETISGLGVGLYLCRKILEKHHGRIWLQSDPGKGSTFFFTLPFDPA